MNQIETYLRKSILRVFICLSISFMAIDNKMQSDAVKNYWKRFVRMDSARNDLETEWKYSDLQVAATIQKDQY